MVPLVVMVQQNQVIGARDILYHASIINLALANWVTNADFHIQRFVSLGYFCVVDYIMGAGIHVIKFTSNGGTSYVNKFIQPRYFLFIPYSPYCTHRLILSAHKTITQCNLAYICTYK
jgi:hypothetical protein